MTPVDEFFDDSYEPEGLRTEASWLDDPEAPEAFDDGDPWDGLELHFSDVPRYNPADYKVRVGDFVRLTAESRHRSKTWPTGTTAQVLKIHDGYPIATVAIQNPPKRRKPWAPYEIALEILQTISPPSDSLASLPKRARPPGQGRNEPPGRRAPAAQKEFAK